MKSYAHLQLLTLVACNYTNRMLGVGLNRSVTFQLVRGIACQVILEDCIVSATAEMKADMT